MIIFNTLAFNAEKTIARTIESVLSQTYERFEYYIIDNGSKDNTFSIMNDYAKTDNRIHLLKNNINNADAIKDGIPITWSTHKIIELASSKYPDNCYFCAIDADDTYSPEFLENMLEFIGVYNLEIAVCGNDFVNSQNYELMGTRKLPRNLILTDQKFVDDFPVYHQFMRTVWGKLFKLSVLGGISEYRNDFFNLVSYGLDTLFSMYAFRNAKRVGILSKSLHQYYISPKSSSYKFNLNRIAADQILHKATLDFLEKKCGEISLPNEDFLYLVYMNAIRDTTNILLKAKIPVSQKLQYLHEIFTHEYTRKLAGFLPLGELIGLDKKEERRQFFNSVVKWMLLQNTIHAGEYFTLVVEMLAAMRVCPADMPGWSSRGKLDLLIALREKIVAESGPTHAVDMRIESMLDTTPLLKNLPVAHAGFLKSVVLPVLSEDYPAAVNALFVLAEGGEIPDEYSESYITLGQNVCAAAEYAQGWIFFGKLWINYLYESTQFDEARVELNELIQLLPDDEDLIALRKMLIS